MPLKFVPKDLFVDKSELDQVVAWCPTSDKPLPEPMLVEMFDACHVLVARLQMS